MSNVNLVQELVALQTERGHLADDDLRALSERLQIPLSEIEAVASFYPHLERTPCDEVRVSICRDLSCRMRGAEDEAARLAALCREHGGARVERVSCLGRCDRAPACAVDGAPAVTSDILSADALGAFAGGRPAEPAPAAVHAWRIDPYDSPTQHYDVLRECLARGDWSAEGDGVIARLERSGLRGMGGAGFSTGTKWRLVAEQPDPTRYVVCNADESEPGTFKDRALLDEVPHLVIEGMILAARSIGARRGWVFIRHEYGAQAQRLREAIDTARANGVLGASVCGSDFTFDLELFVSPGGYILGEETALLEAMEGKRGEPRNKPPYPGQRGLWGKPTLINNVETLAHVPRVLRHGIADLKVFSVSGDVREPGVHEVSVGTTVRELVARCGGLSGDRPLLAFLPGGASTGFLDASHADVPLTWEGLREAGSALGSGGVVAVAEGADLVDLAENLTAFFRNESCGKCVPCRVGTELALKWLGSRSESDLARLPQLDETLRATSLCGLGQVALRPILSVLERSDTDVSGERGRSR